jgi:hypothetical protein
MHKKIALGLLLIVLYIFSITLYKNCEYNWDMIPYTSLMLMIEEQDFNKVHKLTYENIKKEAGVDVFNESISPSPDNPKFRPAMYKDTKAYKEIISLYDIKPLYVFISWCFYKSGFQLIASTVAASVFSYFMIGLLLFIWMSKRLNPYLSLILTICLIGTDTLVDGARYSNPDCLGAMIFFYGTYFLIEKKNYIVSVLLIGLSLLVRPDNVILSGVLFACFFLLGKKWSEISLMKFIMITLVLLIFYSIPKLWTENPGYRVLFYHTFYEYFIYPVSEGHPVTFSQYFNILKSHLFHIFKEPYIIYLFFGLLIFIHLRRNQLSFSNLSITEVTFIAILFATLVRFIIYPFMWPGYWIGYYLLSIMVTIRYLHEYKEAR